MSITDNGSLIIADLGFVLDHYWEQFDTFCTTRPSSEDWVVLYRNRYDHWIFGRDSGVWLHSNDSAHDMFSGQSTK